MTSRKLDFNDSTSSSDAGDILIRSTRVGLQEENGRISRTTHESRPMSSSASQQIKISVRKLDDFFQSYSNDETSNSGSCGQLLLSEDLQANRQPGVALTGDELFITRVTFGSMIIRLGDASLDCLPCRICCTVDRIYKLYRQPCTKKRQNLYALLSPLLFYRDEKAGSEKRISSKFVCLLHS